MVEKMDQKDWQRAVQKVAMKVLKWVDLSAALMVEWKVERKADLKVALMVAGMVAL